MVVFIGGLCYVLLGDELFEYVIDFVGIVVECFDDFGMCEVIGIFG